MLVNIIDERNRPFRWKSVNAIIEDAWHDNVVADSDQMLDSQNICDYEEREHISVEQAITWAQEHKAHVTLYLYDEDSGIYEVPHGGDDEYRPSVPN